MARGEKLPQTVFARFQGADDERFIAAYESLDDTVAQAGEKSKVGRYELREVFEVEATVVAKPVRRSARGGVGT